MRVQRLPIVALLALNVGCVTARIPPDLRDSKRLSVYDITCSEPYQLSVGCKMAIIGTIPVELNGIHFRIAGTVDGRVIAVSDSLGHAAGSSLVGMATLFTVDTQAARLAEAVQAVRAHLVAAGLKITDTIVVTNLGEVQAYLVFTDGNALKALGVGAGVT